MSAIIFTVTNDLNYDQRMQRIAGSLAGAGYQVLLVGRKMPLSVALQPQIFSQKRLRCLFHKGLAFYIEYNLRLFFFLLFHRADILCAIDLDTILPVYFTSLLKRSKRIYDAHELFTEQKEVISRPRILRFWLAIERFAVPRFPLGYTVNEALAIEFQKRYGVSYSIIRNLPLKFPLQTIAPDEKIILYQGAVNEGRCFETLIPAMKGVNARLHIYGTGNFIGQAKQIAGDPLIKDRVLFHEPALPHQLKIITQGAYIGLTLFESKGMNQYHSLANRFFDYIMAAVPQVCVNYPAYAAINAVYDVALLIDNIEPATIAAALNRLLEDDALHNRLKQNCLLAREALNWEAEEQLLLQFYKKV